MQRINGVLCVFGFLFLPLSVCLFAATALAEEGISSTVEAGSCYLSGQYRQVKDIGFDAHSLESTGAFVFSCRHGLIWHTRQPISESLVYLNRGTQYRVLDNRDVETLNSRVHRRLSSILRSLIGNDQDNIAKLFAAHTTEGRVQLVPKSRRLKKFIESVDFSENDSQVDVTIYHKDKQTTAIHIYEKVEHALLDMDICKSLSPAMDEACRYLLQK